MKKRYLYALLFGIPGFFVAGIIALFIFGAATGILWLFVFGDNPWPSFTDKVLLILLVLAFLLLWTTSIAAGYNAGKKLESNPALNWMHILVSGGLTLMVILFIVLQQFSVGNIGPKSDSRVCSEFCIRKGYAASGMNLQESVDRTCTCFDNAGNEALKVPWDTIDPDSAK
ncbi:MAG TPA: hypothetical protein VLE49_00190 [Anaerolineales bacterium]|nr:hypothetical protein [Anaerolineales bacterium]